MFIADILMLPIPINTMLRAVASSAVTPLSAYYVKYLDDDKSLEV